MPPKRALFSLNIDSNADHLYERIEHHNDEDKGKDRVIERTEPTAGSTKVEIVTRPFERAVERTVERIVDGKVVREHRTTNETGNGKRTAKRLEDVYDTSDL